MWCKFLFVKFVQSFLCLIPSKHKGGAAGSVGSNAVPLQSTLKGYQINWLPMYQLNCGLFSEAALNINKHCYVI